MNDQRFAEVKMRLDRLAAIIDDLPATAPIENLRMDHAALYDRAIAFGSSHYAAFIGLQNLERQIAVHVAEETIARHATYLEKALF